ncbi:hypothetical protein N665_0197s0052 [Sinapis alba]|nr:hypothetical protein N665_0197s0052 [Sinapis alba]
MVEQRTRIAMSKIDIVVPSLERLCIRTVTKKDNGLRYSPYEKSIPKDLSPSLKYLNIDDRGNDFDVIKDLSQVVEANINANDLVIFTDHQSYLYLNHKHLKAFLSFQDKDPNMFCQLVNLELCTSTSSHKLRVLKLFNLLDAPSCVPQCMLSRLETLEWRGYLGREIDNDIMSYLLKHSLCLRTVKITPNESKFVEEMHQMVEVLASLSIVSKTCKLVFDL